MTKLKIDFLSEEASIVFEWQGKGPWSRLKNAFLDTEDTFMEGDSRFLVRWSDFLMKWEEEIYPILRDLDNQGLIEVSPKIQELLEKANSRRKEIEQIPEQIESKLIQPRLESLGWCKDSNEVRKLTENQLNNVSKLMCYTGAANFSVPGAGKTTEALAYFLLKSQSINSALLVVAPLSAFPGWEEDTEKCLGKRQKIVRLNSKNINSVISTKKPKKMIVSYDLFSRSEHLNKILNYLYEVPTILILDESHRIKNPDSKRARAAYHLSPFSSDKMILTGTPMPQDEYDLISQYNFLYPERPIINPNEAMQELRPIFVRTTKDQLQLPPLDVHPPVQIPLKPKQAEVYGLLKQDYRRRASEFRIMDRAALQALGAPILRILKFLSNPSLIAAELDKISENVSDNLVNELILEGNGPKVERSIAMVKDLVAKGEKVLIWSYFKDNITIISESLKEINIGAVWIHGGVKTGDEEDIEFREGRIKKFKEDPDTHVLVANPAAAGEGISLHDVCHNAIYNDRTYNATHYLQSQDRIHRLGLPKNTKSNIHILQYADTVDLEVEAALDRKISNMNAFLNSGDITPNPEDWTDESLLLERQLSGQAVDMAVTDLELLNESMSQ